MTNPIPWNLRGSQRSRPICHGGMVLLLLALLDLPASAGEPQDEKADPATDTVAATPDVAYPPARMKPPSFEYAQCANACQIERDQLLSVCGVPDNPNRPKYDKPVDCTHNNINQFLACLAMCPADTGEEVVP